MLYKIAGICFKQIEPIRSRVCCVFSGKGDKILRGKMR